MDGSSEYGASKAAVRDPSAPSVKPLSAPVLSQGSLVPPCARIFKQLIHRLKKWQPLRNAQRELPFFFQLHINKKIRPIGKILRRGHAVFGGIGKHHLDAAAALVGFRDQESWRQPDSSLNLLRAFRWLRRRRRAQSCRPAGWACLAGFRRAAGRANWPRPRARKHASEKRDSLVRRRRALAWWEISCPAKACDPSHCL